MSGAERTASQRLIASVAVIGIVYYAAALILLHLVRPDVDPISGVTVEYAFGEYAWLMRSAFLMLSVGSFALLLGLLRTLALPARSMTGLTLLGVLGARPGDRRDRAVRSPR